MKIEPESFYQQYIDPHKKDVAEWGAVVGYYQRDPVAAKARVVELVETVVARAGLGVSVRFTQCEKHLQAVEGLRATVRSRLHDAFARLTGDKPFSSHSWLRNSLEGLLDVAALLFLPFVLLGTWPSLALARHSFNKAEERERNALEIRNSARVSLLLHFGEYVEKGALARDIEAGVVVRAAGKSSPAARPPVSANGVTSHQD